MTWLITGASRGLGRALAASALEAGHRVAAAVRDPRTVDDLVRAHPGRCLPVRLDVTVPAEIAAAVADTLDVFCSLDVLVNNAGLGLEGAIEEVSDTQIEEQLATNLLAPVRLVRAVLPHMRAARKGHIVQISSAASQAAVPALGLYQAAKWGLEGVSESLALEVAPLGIHVTIVEPGRFRTDFAGSSMARSTPMPWYDATAGQARRLRAASAGQQPGDPRRAAEALLAAVASPRPPLRLALGPDAVQLIRASLESRLRELEQWEQLSKSTDFTDGQ
ncbi:oxidoreductase [Streptomyces sp. HMX87]|uniref:oxidoreductase n=1 Tax=Streptomyces sp. HMX87 TaxID=3390849 RepID=UPI003A853AA8